MLVEDSSVSYAQIGRAVSLSAPSVYERAKRMRKANVIRSSAARLDPKCIGKPLLTFVMVSVRGNAQEALLRTFRALPEVEEIHTIAGDHCLIMKVRTTGPEALEELLGMLHETDSVHATQSYVVLSTKLERPVQAEIGVGSLDGESPRDGRGR